MYCVYSRVITVAPQLQALLLVGETHAVVAVGQSVLTGGAVQQVDVGRTVRRRPGAVLWQVTSPCWTPAHGTCLFQLAESGSEQRRRKQKRRRGDVVKIIGNIYYKNQVNPGLQLRLLKLKFYF